MENGHTCDRVPIIDPPEIQPGPPRTEETVQQLEAQEERLGNLEKGVVPENELLEDSVITDNDLATENLQNDSP